MTESKSAPGRTAQGTQTKIKAIFKRPRFKRKTAIEPFRLTDRDLGIIKLVHDHRYLTSEQLFLLLNGSHKNFLKRLLLLYHDRYLERPAAQTAQSGSNPMVYGLGENGAEVLHQRFGLPKSQLEEMVKACQSKHLFLEHALMISHFRACLAAACRRSETVDLLSQSEIRSRHRTDLPMVRNKPLSWRVTAQVPDERDGNKQEEHRPMNLPVVPDLVFGLRFAGDRRRKQEALFFLEADRSTMPLWSSSLKRSSLRRKVLAYTATWRQGELASGFGFDNSRVLIVTDSDKRVESMVELTRRMDKRNRGLRLFQFAPISALPLAEPHKIFDDIWINGRGEPASILD